MACRGFWECLLKLLNLLLILAGLAMIGYGVYLFVEYKNVASNGDHGSSISPSSGDFVQLGRPMLLIVSLADSMFDKLPKAWFIYLFTGIGVIVLFIACCGCIGTATRNGCCLTCYSALLILLILVELGAATFIFFDNKWKEEIPIDKTGNFDVIYGFLEKHWEIVRWVALGAVVLQVIIFLLALIVRAANSPADYDSDEECIGAPRQQIRQPLINGPTVPPATGVPVGATFDQHPRSDAWSARMREKYGLNTSEFTYNPSESNRYPLAAATQPSEERSRCIIM